MSKSTLILLGSSYKVVDYNNYSDHAVYQFETNYLQSSAVPGEVSICEFMLNLCLKTASSGWAFCILNTFT